MIYKGKAFWKMLNSFKRVKMNSSHSKITIIFSGEIINLHAQKHRDNDL